MQKETLKAEARQDNGTRAARRLRREGKLPAIIYGHKQEPEKVAVDAHAVSMLLEHGTQLVELSINGSNQQVLIKDVQFENLGIDPLHIDFIRVNPNERVTVTVPLEFRGTPIGVTEGGILDQDMVGVEVECLATQIPEIIRVNIADLKLEESVYVRDLTLPENVTAITHEDQVVCSVHPRRGTAAEEEEEAAEETAVSEPELIRRREKEEAGEA